MFSSRGSSSGSIIDKYLICEAVRFENTIVLTYSIKILLNNIVTGVGELYYYFFKL